VDSQQQQTAPLGAAGVRGETQGRSRTGRGLGREPTGPSGRVQLQPSSCECGPLVSMF